MNYKIWLIIGMVGLSILATAVPGWQTMVGLIIGIFVVVHLVPRFRSFASMYVLIFTYGLSVVPMFRIVISWLKENWKENWKEYYLPFEYWIDFENLIWTDIVVIGGIVLLIVQIMAIFCTYQAGQIWRNQKTLPEKEASIWKIYY